MVSLNASREIGRQCTKSLARTVTGLNEVTNLYAPGTRLPCVIASVAEVASSRSDWLTVEEGRSSKSQTQDLVHSINLGNQKNLTLSRRDTPL